MSNVINLIIWVMRLIRNWKFVIKIYFLTLALFVLFCLTNHIKAAASFDHLAGVAHFFDRRANFHFFTIGALFSLSLRPG